MFKDIIDEIKFPFEDYFDDTVVGESITFKEPIYLYHITADDESFRKCYDRNHRTSFAPSIIQCILGMGHHSRRSITSIYRTKNKVSDFFFPDCEPDYMLTQECVAWNHFDYNDLVCIAENINLHFDVRKSCVEPIMKDNLRSGFYYPNFRNRADGNRYDKQVEEYRDLLEYQLDIDIVSQLITCPNEQEIHENNWTNEYRGKYL